MDGISKEICDLPEMYTCLAIVTISLVIHIIFLKKWPDNRAKNEKLMEMIQTLQRGNERLAERIHSIENDNYHLAGKIYSTDHGNEKLTEKFFSCQRVMTN